VAVGRLTLPKGTNATLTGRRSPAYAGVYDRQGVRLAHLLGALWVCAPHRVVVGLFDVLWLFGYANKLDCRVGCGILVLPLWLVRWVGRCFSHTDY
jgi:hypothetical protein